MATVVEVLARLRADHGGFIRNFRAARDEVRGLDAQFDAAAGRWRRANGQFMSSSELAKAGLSNVAKEADKVASRTRHLTSTLLTAAGAVAKVASAAGGAASLLGPAAIGLVKAAAAGGQFLVAMAPLVATLPALAGGLALVKGTLKLAGPAMAESVAPVAAAFTNVQGRIGRLASDGLPALSREFVKVNFPTIQRGMERVAMATNGVVRQVGLWVNTGQGQHAIATIVNSTAAATERLAPKMAWLGMSVGNMINRVGDPAIRGFASLLGTMADRTKAWADSITRDSVTAAIASAKDAAGAFADKMRAIRDIVEWIGNNTGKVKAMSDALAVIGIVLGVATGGWVGVIAGAVALILNHWAALKPGLAKAGAWASETGKRIWEPFYAGLQGKGAIEGFTGRLNDLGLSFRALVSAFKDPDITSNGLVGSFEELGSAARTAYDAVSSGAQKFWMVAGPPLRALGGAIMDYVLPVFLSLQSFVLNSVIPTFMRLAEPIGRVVAAIATALVPILRTLQEQFVTNILPALQSLWASIDKHVVPVLIRLAGWIAAAARVLGVLIPPILTVAGPVLGVLIKALGWVIGVAARLVQIILQVIATFIRGAWAVAQFVAGLIAGFVRAVAAVGQLKGRIVSAISGAGEWLLDAGRAVMRGLLGGLKSGWEGVKTFLSWVTDKIPDWKGPVARDAKLLVNNGRLVMRSFQVGLESQYAKVRSSLGRFTTGLPAHASSQANGPQGASRVLAADAMPSMQRPGWAAADTQGDSRSNVALRIDSAGSRLDDLLVEVIRKAVRTLGGGDVQAAFGRS